MHDAHKTLSQFHSFKKFIEECSSIADILREEEYAELNAEVGAKEEVHVCVVVSL